MALPTCAVVCAIHDQEGAPVPGATFEFRLNRHEVYEGFVVPTRAVGTAGEDGTCTVNLWPNQLGSAESAYNVTIRSPGGRAERVTATIPNVATVNLHDVSALPPYPGKPDAQVYLETAQGIVEDAQAAAASSASSAQQSGDHATASQASASAASGSAGTAATQAAAAAASAAAAAASANAAATSETNSSNSATSSGASAAAASASATLVQSAISDFLATGIGAYRNRLINGDFSVNVRALASVADDAYFLDRWYALTESGTLTPSQLTDPESGAPFGLRLTQPDAAPKRMGFAQIIESKNIRQFATRAMHLAARLRLSTGGAIRFAVIEHTGTADVVVSDVVSNWASTNFTAGNFFIAGLNILRTGSITPGAATWGEVSEWDALSAGVKNVIVFIWTESQAAQNVTLDCSRIQYEPGVVATPHEWRMDEDVLCSRYCLPLGAARIKGQATSASNVAHIEIFTPTPMRSLPAISSSSHMFTNATNGQVGPFTVTVTSMVGSMIRLDASGGSGLVAGNVSVLVPTAGTFLTTEL